MKTLLDNIYSSFPKEVARLLVESFEKDCFHSFWFNEQKIKKEELINLFPNLIPHPYVKNAFIYDKNEYDLGTSYLHKLGAIYIQDASSQMNPFYLDIKPGENVLDICSAPGGKALQASYMMKSDGVLLANDISLSRLQEEISNIERMGASNILITNNDFTTLNINKLPKFHKIILDAPCSGSGMVRKDKKMLLDWSYNKVIKFQEIQKNLILKAFDLLLPGGRMCYSTCSFSKEENEDVINYLLENRNAKIIPIEKHDDLYIDESNLGVHFLPSLFKGEGQYCCLIEKEGFYEIKNNRNSYLLDYTEMNERSSLIFKDKKYSLPFKFNYENLHVIRYGLLESEIDSKNNKPEYHLSHSLKNFPIEYELNDDEYFSFLKGNTINSTIKGWILMKYKGIGFSFGKGDGRIIKNHLPKGLRYP